MDPYEKKMKISFKKKIALCFVINKDAAIKQSPIP